MPYSEEKDIKQLWKASKDAPAGLIASCIIRAYNRINGMLVNRYSVPFSTTPPLIATLSDELVIYLMKRALNPGGGELDDTTIYTYKEAGEDLIKISKGEISLLDDGGNLIATKETISSTTEDYAPIFDLDATEDHAIDSDRLGAIEDARN